MRRADVIAGLKKTEPVLRGFGVASLYLFGSHARNEASSKSDVDVFIDPASDEEFGFLPFKDACEALRNAFSLGPVSVSDALVALGASVAGVAWFEMYKVATRKGAGRDERFD